MSAPIWEAVAVGALLLAAAIYLGRLGLHKLRVLRAAGKLESGSVCGGSGGGCHCAGGSAEDERPGNCFPGSR